MAHTITNYSEFTPAQLNRQDVVDTTIHEMLCALAGAELPWDICAIAQIRELAYTVIAQSTGISEMNLSY
jgi:hypothetical protein